MSKSADETEVGQGAGPDVHEVAEATETQAPNGMGTVTKSPTGDTLDRPILDGATVDYGEEGRAKNPRYGQENPELIRDTETGEETPTPDEGD